MPTSPSSALTVPLICSRSASWLSSQSSRGAAQRAEDADRHAGVGAGGVDDEVGAIFQRLDALRALVPRCQAVAPGVGRLVGEGFRRHVLAPGVVGVDPGQEVLGLQVGEGQQQVGDVALGIDDDRRHLVQRGLFQQVDAEAGLAAAGHADADRVGGQVAGVVHQGRLAQRAGGEVEILAKVESAKFLCDGHVFSPSCWCGNGLVCCVWRIRLQTPQL